MLFQSRLAGLFDSYHEAAVDAWEALSVSIPSSGII